MKKLFILFIFFITYGLSLAYAEELEAGKWNFIVNDNYCYIGSFPIKKDMPSGKKRGDTYIIVYRINKNPDAVIQIDAGYPYDENKSVEVTIDKASFNFYSKDDTAWTEEDIKVIYAMKKGINLIVKGYSSRGTMTTDSYSLNGFTSAFNKLSKEC